MRRIYKTTTALVACLSIIAPQLAVAQVQQAPNGDEQLILPKKKPAEAEQKPKAQAQEKAERQNEPQKKPQPRQEPEPKQQQAQEKPKPAKALTLGFPGATLSYPVVRGFFPPLERKTP